MTTCEKTARCKRPFRRLLSLFIALLLMLQMLPMGMLTASAAEEDEKYVSTIATPTGENCLINPDYDRSYDNYVVKSNSGLVHPGYYIDRAGLNTMRDMIWQGIDPWKSSFEEFRKSGFSSLDYKSSGPFETISSDRETYSLIRDFQAAYYLSLMWYITGWDDYADKAIDIMNHWANTLKADNKKDIIRNGGAIPYIVLAGEILRYTPSSGWGSAQELAAYEKMLRLLIPGVDRKDGYYNQGNYAVNAYLAASIYLDDYEMYQDAIERAVYNVYGYNNKTYNFSMQSMILETGQQVEMGRDIPHAQGSMGPFGVMAYTTLIQDTLVDQKGNITTEDAGGVNIFEVGNQKLLKYLAYFCKYNLGEDVIWQPVNGLGLDMEYDTITIDGRGRIHTGLNHIYSYYKNIYDADQVRTDPYIDNEDGYYLDLYGGNTYGDLFKYIDIPRETNGIDGDGADGPGYAEMVITPWTVSVGQTGSGYPTATSGELGSYDSYGRIAGVDYVSSGGTEGGCVNEPVYDEDGIARFMTSNCKNGCWIAYNVDFAQFGSTPNALTDILQFTYGMSSDVGGSIDVRIGNQRTTPEDVDYKASTLAGTIRVPNTGWYDIFNTHTEKLTVKPELLVGQKTVYFYYYGSSNGYNFHCDTLWFKFTSASMSGGLNAVDANIVSDTASMVNENSVTLTNGGYVAFDNIDFDKGFQNVDILAKANVGKIKLVLGNPTNAPIAEYNLFDTAGDAALLSFNGEEGSGLLGRNNGDNTVYLIYEGDGSVDLFSFTGTPAVKIKSFEPIPGAGFALQISGQNVTRENNGSVKITVAKDDPTVLTYRAVPFYTGPTTLRIQVKSDIDAVMQVDLLNEPGGLVSTFDIPSTEALGTDGWITLEFDLSLTGFNHNDSPHNMFKITVSSDMAGTVEMMDFFLNQTGAYPVLSADNDRKTVLLNAGMNYQNTVTAVATDGNAVPVNLVTAPKGVVYGSSTGTLQWEVPQGIEGETGYFTFAATGNDGLSTSVYRVQYTVLGDDDYIRQLLDDTQAMIAEINGLAEDDYYPFDWAKLMKAVSYSQEILDQDTWTKEEAENAYFSLAEKYAAITPIPPIDVLAEVANVTLSNGTTGENAASIAGLAFDNRTETYPEWSGSGQWYKFDFGEDKALILERGKFLARQGWGKRINGVRLQGSHDGTNWTTLTENCEDTQEWQKRFSNDTTTAYRYLRLYNSISWSANIAELRVYGTIVNTAFQFDAFPAVQRIMPRITYTYTFSATHVNGESLAFTLEGGEPDGMTIDADTGKVTWEVPDGAEDQYNFIIGVSQGKSSNKAFITLLRGDKVLQKLYDQVQSQYIDEGSYTPIHGSSVWRALEYAMYQAKELLESGSGETEDYNSAYNSLLKTKKAVDLFATQPITLNDGTSTLDMSKISTIFVSDGKGIDQYLVLIDGNISTYSEFYAKPGDNWSSGGKGASIAFDLGEGNSLSLTDVSLQARSNWSNRILGTIFQGSNDGVAWTTTTAAAIDDANMQSLAIADNQAYRYIRVYNASAWSGNMSELRVNGNIHVDNGRFIDFLENTIAESEGVTDSERYTDESWETFIKAVENAKSVLSDTTNTQAAIDAAEQNLRDAINDLMRRPVDKLDLYELLLEAAEMLKNVQRYPQSAVDHLEDIMANAQEVYGDDTVHDDAVVEDACITLRAAIQLAEKVASLKTIAEIKGAVIDSSNELDYTLESWAAYQKALDKANEILSDVTKYSEEEIYAVRDTLVKVELVLGTDKQGLSDAITLVKKMMERKDKYLPEEIAVLEVALLVAEDIYLDADATQVDVNSIIQELVSAVHGLVRKGDMEDLQTLYDLFNQLDENDYTTASWTAFQDAMDLAKSLLEKGEASSLQIQAVIDALLEAYGQLARSETVGKAGVQAMIKIAEDILANADNYVSDSLKGLQEKLDAAKAVYDNPNVTQAEVNAARKALTEQVLLARLKEKITALQFERQRKLAYISGYTDGTVKPNGEITRAEVAQIFYNLFTDESKAAFETEENNFTDVTQKHWANKAISTLAKSNVINGYGDDSFRPDAKITRAELVTMVAKMYDLTDVDVEHIPFKDSKTHWAKISIAFAAEQGFIGGYPDKTFKPRNNITRAETVTVMNAVLNRTNDDPNQIENMKTFPDNLVVTAWFYKNIQLAANDY